MHLMLNKTKSSINYPTPIRIEKLGMISPPRSYDKREEDPTHVLIWSSMTHPYTYTQFREIRLFYYRHPIKHARICVYASLMILIDAKNLTRIKRHNYTLDLFVCHVKLSQNEGRHQCSSAFLLQLALCPGLFLGLSRGSGLHDLFFVLAQWDQMAEAGDHFSA